jgi:hypothetical protein
MAGPEEMKWPQKCLYTYNVQNGDKFILDEKVSLGRLRSRSGSSNQGFSPGSLNSPGRFSFTMSPGKLSGVRPSASPKSKVSRNLFGTTEKEQEESPITKNLSAGN